MTIKYNEWKWGTLVQAAHFLVDKPDDDTYEVATEDGYLFDLMTEFTPNEFAAELKNENKIWDQAHPIWRQTSTDEVVFEKQPKEVNIVV